MQGSYHPITRFFIESLAFFERFGFDVVEGPEIDNQKFNFDLLRIPALHPARDMQDTFWLDEHHLLRTQTSNVQIRAMQDRQAPVRLISPGRVYRHEAIDATHLPLFHQLEGLVIEKEANIGQLMATVESFLKHYLAQELTVRFRPSYFPFVEPGLEVDIFWQGRWMEVLGCGMTHPEVIENMGIDSKKWRGFAFGIGVERMIMVKYGINDIRILFGNDYRLLKQLR